MESLILKLIALINQANGVLLWDNMLEALSFEERQMLVRAIAQARSENRLRRHIRFDPSTRKNILTLQLPTSGGE